MRNAAYLTRRRRKRVFLAPWSHLSPSGHVAALDVLEKLREPWERVNKCNGSLHYISEKSHSLCFAVSSDKTETRFYFFVRKLFFVLIPNSPFNALNLHLSQGTTQSKLDTSFVELLSNTKRHHLTFSRPFIYQVKCLNSFPVVPARRPTPPSAHALCAHFGFSVCCLEIKLTERRFLLGGSEAATPPRTLCPPPAMPLRVIAGTPGAGQQSRLRLSWCLVIPYCPQA